MKNVALIIALLTAIFTFAGSASAGVSVPGSSGLSVRNNGCSARVGNGLATIVCTRYESIVVQWSTRFNGENVSFRGLCTNNRNWKVMRYWRSGGRDRVNVRFTGPIRCSVRRIIFT
jgi:hypothetical protein